MSDGFPIVTTSQKRKEVPPSIFCRTGVDGKGETTETNTGMHGREVSTTANQGGPDGRSESESCLFFASCMSGDKFFLAIFSTESKPLGNST